MGDKPRETRIQKKNKAAILEAALEVFSTHGFRGSTVDQIASEAGLSKPNLLYYFPSKEAIHAELLSGLLDTWLDPLRELDPEADPIPELLAYVRAPNLARALYMLKENGFWTVGLAGEAETPIAAAPFDRPTAIVIGAEGSGLRRLTLERCDAAVHIPMAPNVESLNLATAAAIALYEKSRANAAIK